MQRFRTLFLLMLLPLAACQSLLGSDSARDESRSAEGLELSIRAGTSQTAPGDTVTLTAKLTNTGASAVTIQLPSGCQAMVYVEDAAGKVVFPFGGDWVCAAVITELQLAPGESREYPVRWPAQRATYDPATGRESYTPLPAGSYRAYATLHGSTATTRSLRLRSSEVVVRVG